MRTCVFALALIAGFSLSPPTAQAQRFGTLGGPISVAPLTYEAPISGYAIPSYGAPRLIGGVYVPEYGYSRATYPYPARVYSGYGSNDFPFHGRPYGPAWEPWSWSALSQYPAYPTSAYGVIGR